ncbi:MAG: hypothetical protein K9L30_13645 [Desulfobacterales bacterium]|nr:hypothetical protein [Desulfobacterales bacterium]
MNINFVIIASQRTGSNMLVSALENHPHVRCHGELFRRENVKMSGALKILKLLTANFQSVEYRDTHYKEYLEAVNEKDGKGFLFGFKLMFNQSEQAMNWLIQEPRIKKVLLFRENLLAMYASHQIAKATGQGAVRVGGEVRQAKVAFNPKHFKRFLKNHTKRYKEAKKQLKKRPASEWIEVGYPEICKIEKIAGVMEFLGVDANIAPIIISTVKRNSNNIVERFINPDAVIEHLKTIDRMAWAEEHVD